MTRLTHALFAALIATPMVVGMSMAQDQSAAQVRLDEMDTNRDGVIDRAEAKDYYDDLYRRMARIDGRPGVEEDEFAEAPFELGRDMREKLERQWRNELEDRFEDLDYNRDDVVDLGEFLDAPLPAVAVREFKSGDAERAERDRELRFEQLDTDKNMLLTRDEYTALPDTYSNAPMSQAERERSMERRRSAFRALDANEDGLMSRLEFLNAQWSFFARADANGDDELDRYELRAARTGVMSARPTPRYEYNRSTDADRDEDRPYNKAWREDPERETSDYNRDHAWRENPSGPLPSNRDYSQDSRDYDHDYDRDRSNPYDDWSNPDRGSNSGDNDPTKLPGY